MQHLQGRLALKPHLRDQTSGSQPFRWSWLIVLCLAYLLPGSIGHDPWKPDEGYVFGSINEMLQSGDWVVPHVGGEPFMEKPPAFHWLALATATLASPWLALHDGARLASIVFMLLTLLGVALMTRWTSGPTRMPAALVLTLACLGLPDPAHMILPDLPQLAGSALALAGLAGHAAGIGLAGLLFGGGVGLAFLGKGLLVPGMLGITVLLLPLVFPSWRRRELLRFLFMAALAVLPWLLAWPVALYLRSPELFRQWLWDNNIGRFLGTSVSFLGAANEPGLFWRSTPWFLFPAWLFAALSLAAAGRQALRQPQYQIGMLFLLVATVTLSQSGSLRTVYLLPLIPAVAVMGTDAALSPPRWLNAALAALGTLIAVAALALFWPVWLALLVDGQLPSWALRLQKWLPAIYAMPMQPIAVGAATLLSLWATFVIATNIRQSAGGLRIWISALALAWGLLMTLWLPWLNEAKSYRTPFTALAGVITTSGCIASRDLGESERAVLNYFSGIQTQRLEVAGDVGCPLLLVQSRRGTITKVGDEWAPLWSGARAGEHNESFQLYQR